MNRIEVIAKLIQDYKMADGMGAEIGVCTGLTLFSLLKLFPNLRMLGVDKWEYVLGYGDKVSNGYASYLGKQIHRHYFDVMHKAMEYGKRVKIFKLDSITAAETCENDSFDFVFIDADHRESFVRADIAVWLPKVKPGGLLLGHDIHRISVRSAVNSFFDTFKEFDDYVWMIEKN